jgi:hypothetical protein
MGDCVPGFKELFLDTDRGDVERTLAVLERVGNYADAARIAGERLERRMSQTWGSQLSQRIYSDLILAAQQRQPNEARPLLAQAAEFAKARSLDATSATALLRVLELEASVAGKVESASKIAQQWIAERFALLLAWGDSLANNDTWKQDPLRSNTDWMRLWQSGGCERSKRSSRPSSLLICRPKRACGSSAYQWMPFHRLSPSS